jgi:hypothetical protein
MRGEIRVHEAVKRFGRFSSHKKKESSLVLLEFAEDHSEIFFEAKDTMDARS